MNGVKLLVLLCHSVSVIILPDVNNYLRGRKSFYSSAYYDN